MRTAVCARSAVPFSVCQPPHVKPTIARATAPPRDVMADTASAEELKAKRASDYDDVVRDYRKRKGNLADHGYQFNRDCGKAIEAALTKIAPKS